MSKSSSFTPLKGYIVSRWERIKLTIAICFASVTVLAVLVGGCYFYYHGEELIKDISSTSLTDATDRCEAAQKAKLGFRSIESDILILKSINVPFQKYAYFLNGRSRGDYTLESQQYLQTVLTDHRQYLEKNKKAAEHTIRALFIIIFVQYIFFAAAIIFDVLTGEFLNLKLDAKVSNPIIKKVSMPIVNIFAYSSLKSSSILTTIGVAGTFYGLMQGLGTSQNAQSAVIDITILFKALSISFLSTLFGIGLGLLVRLLQQAFAGKPVKMETLNATIGNLQERIAENVASNTRAQLEEWNTVSKAALRNYTVTIKECAVQNAKVNEELKRNIDFLVDCNDEYRVSLELQNQQAEAQRNHLERAKELNEIITKAHKPTRHIVKAVNRFYSAMDRAAFAQEKYDGKLQKAIQQLDRLINKTSVTMDLTRASLSAKSMSDILSSRKRDDNDQ